jgi:hypothetical protein
VHSLEAAQEAAGTRSVRPSRPRPRWRPCGPLSATAGRARWRTLEIETRVDEADVTAALDDIRAVLEDLGIGPKDLTRETYTGAVAAQRR